MSELLKAFVIGSSWPIFIPYFYFVAQSKDKNFKYTDYSMIAPLYFGIMNVLSLFVSKDRFTGLFIISQISALMVIMLITRNKSYDFGSKKRWIQQYMLVYLAHLMSYMMIYTIERGTKVPL